MARAKGFATVITHLEMTAQPKGRAHLPLNAKAALMRAEAIPLHFYRYLMYRTGKPWNWVYRLRMTDDDLAAIVHAPTTDIDVLYLDGAPVGFFEIDRSREGVSDLAYFGLMGHAIGRGVGRWFLREAVDSAWRSDPQKVTVNTCTLDHPAALGLYQKLGFVPVGRGEASIRPLTDKELVHLARLD